VVMVMAGAKPVQVWCVAVPVRVRIGVGITGKVAQGVNDKLNSRSDLVCRDVKIGKHGYD